MWGVWRVFSGGRLWSLSVLCWQAEIWWTWQKEAMLCKAKVWVNNNCPCTEIIMLTFTSFMCRFTAVHNKVRRDWISQDLSSQLCTGLLLTSFVPLCMVLVLCFCSLHHLFTNPSEQFRTCKKCVAILSVNCIASYIVSVSYPGASKWLF